MKWKELALAEGQVLMMMGSAGPAAAIPLEPISSSSNKDVATAIGKKEELYTPCGLMNLGNTCYFNASLQCLSRIPELKSALINFHEVRPKHSEAATEMTARLSGAMGSLLDQMKRAESVPPLVVLQVHTYRCFCCKL